MDAGIPMLNKTTVTFDTTDDNNILSINLTVSNKDVLYSGVVDREQVVNLLRRLNDLLLETNGELKKGDVIAIGSKHASDGVLHDYSDKVGLRAIVVDPNALWDTDEEGNEVRFVWATLEGKKRNKYVDIHIEDAVRVTV